MVADISQEVDQLLKEREKYEGWLKRLESERGQANERAFDRVRADYQKRLNEVVSKLKAHSASLQQKLQDMERRVGELEAERAGLSEQLEEARLRRSVGEYRDDGEWQALESGMLDSLKKAEQELEGVRGEISRLQGIMGTVGGAPPAAAPAPEKATTPSGPEAAPPAAGPAEPPEPKPAAAPPEETPVTEAAGATATPNAAGDEPSGEEEGFLSLEELVLEDKEPSELGLEPGAAGRSGGGTESEPAQAEDAAASGEAEVGDELAFLESLSLGGGEEEAESFSFLEQKGSGTPQTIICPHCSAANDPAEWYCTECGEELPAE